METPTRITRLGVINFDHSCAKEQKLLASDASSANGLTVALVIVGVVVLILAVLFVLANLCLQSALPCFIIGRKIEQVINDTETEEEARDGNDEERPLGGKDKSDAVDTARQKEISLPAMDPIQSAEIIRVASQIVQQSHHVES
jgi:hypothetical protein